MECVFGGEILSRESVLSCSRMSPSVYAVMASLRRNDDVVDLTRGN